MIFTQMHMHASTLCTHARCIQTDFHTCAQALAYADCSYSLSFNGKSNSLTCPRQGVAIPKTCPSFGTGALSIWFVNEFPDFANLSWHRVFQVTEVQASCQTRCGRSGGLGCWWLWVPSRWSKHHRRLCKCRNLCTQLTILTDFSGRIWNHTNVYIILHSRRRKRKRRAMVCQVVDREFTKMIGDQWPARDTHGSWRRTGDSQ